MLNQGQQYGYDVVMSGYNVFITGEAGTGKSYLVNEIVKAKTEQGYTVAITAPTGIAADNISGVTIHNLLHIKPDNLYYALIGNEIKDIAIENLQAIDVLVIDEISMCRIDLFDVLCRHIADANKIRKRYNKRIIQLILVGDFFQLPPVVTDSDSNYLNKYYGHDVGTAFPFESQFWNMLDLKYILLTDIVRQKDSNFTAMLNKVRVGDKSAITGICNSTSPVEMNRAITLYGRNFEAYNKNILELEKLPGEAVDFQAIIKGDVSDNDSIADRNLLLKPYARVMTIVNDKDGRYVNGSFGTLIDASDTIVRIKFDNGNICDIERYTWEVYSYRIEEDENKNKVIKRFEIGSITQFPIKLAYAITIHKSQGQTYDAMNLSPYCWDCGQLYVALSRVRNIQNLYLKYAIYPQDVVVSLNVIKFYNEIIDKTNNQVVDLHREVENKSSEKAFTSDMDIILSKLGNI